MVKLFFSSLDKIIFRDVLKQPPIIRVNVIPSQSQYKPWLRIRKEMTLIKIRTSKNNPNPTLKKWTPSKFQNKREVLYIDFGQLVLQEKFDCIGNFDLNVQTGSEPFENRDQDLTFFERRILIRQNTRIQSW